MHCTYRSLLVRAFDGAFEHTAITPQSFLVPSFSSTQTRDFTSSATLHKRRTQGRDRNPWRGVSALRHTGIVNPKKLSFAVDVKDLPKPVLDPKLRSKVEVDEDHGLWAFFNNERTTLTEPQDVAAHGRGWTVADVRNKDWDDLHRLYWVCVKEKNQLATESRERARLGRMYGADEERDRLKEINKTMKSIKFALTERYYAWQNARELAMENPKIYLG